jgi:NADPH2:quinone reductase
MWAARCLEYGPPESLVIEEVPDPVAGPGEAVVRIEAAAVNYPDVLIAANKYQLSIPPPFIPGSEFAGVIESVGDGVHSVHPGDRVRGGTFVGAFAQKVVVRAEGLSLVTWAMDLRSAAAYHVTYATAYHALRSVGEVSAGDWVVVLGAAGGVGMAAVDLAQLLGGRVIAAASSEDKLAVCAARGAEVLINYDSDDLKTRIKQATGMVGADVVIDPVGGAYAEEALRAVRWGGRFVTVGFASGEIPRIPLNLVLLKGVIIKGFEIRTFAEHAADDAQRDDKELDALAMDGRIRPHIFASFSLAETAAALRAVADRRAIGKVLIEPQA